MVRPPERTWAHGIVPYEDTPHVCQECGIITKWLSEPHLVGHYSEEPDVIAAFNDYRGMPLPDEQAMKEARRRPGGKIHRHFSFANEAGEMREQGVGGSYCANCAQATMDEFIETRARRQRLAELLKGSEQEPAVVKPPASEPKEGV